MNYEIQLKCNHCDTELTELTINTTCVVNLIWNKVDNQYEAHFGSYGTDEVNEYICPICHQENVIEPELIQQHNE